MYIYFIPVISLLYHVERDWTDCSPASTQGRKQRAGLWPERLVQHKDYGTLHTLKKVPGLQEEDVSPQEDQTIYEE